jgi:2-polyprenyl-6-methoxyphenol hydroxylase-like FAD-dependent oxidoreductase
LEILYEHLPNRDKVFINHEVVKVETDATGVTVTCKNGSVFTGSMVVGADGINSAVRKSIWDITRLRDPEVSKKAAECE